MYLCPVSFEKRVRNIGPSIDNVEDSITLISPQAEIFELAVLFLDPFSECLPSLRKDTTPPGRRVRRRWRCQSDYPDAVATILSPLDATKEPLIRPLLLASPAHFKETQERFV